MAVRLLPVGMAEPLLELVEITKRWEDILVLDRISLTVGEGEFVALLGPSGSGKSTLLRIVTGLVPPTSGEVRYRGRPISGPNPYAAMVFQTFALYPWLTVLENVEIGLKAQGMSRNERREKAKRLIDLIGLDGFEDAFPKELSGGMRQRVGFARALAVEPELLCMDEPFSALDFLTAENLRAELLELWTERRIPTKAILMVTHGIEEAVFMADRIVILSKDPARVSADVPVLLPRPRNRKSPEFLTLVDRVYKIVTDGADAYVLADGKQDRAARARLHPLPAASIGMLTGLLELVADRGGSDDLFHLGSELLLEVDDLLPVTEAAELLGFAEVREGDLVLTPLGRRFTEADAAQRKEIFARQVRDLPLFALIRRVLEGKRSKTMPREFFLELFEEHFGAAAAGKQLDTAINWGRYAELFSYDPASEELYIENGSDSASPGEEARRTGP